MTPHGNIDLTNIGYELIYFNNENFVFQIVFEMYTFEIRAPSPKGQRVVIHTTRGYV